MSKKDVSSNPATIARSNLRNAMSSPVAKVGAVAMLITCIGVGGAAVSILRSKGEKVAAADAQNYAVSAGEPRGEVDEKTARAVEKKVNQEFESSVKEGESYAGPFAYAGVGKDGSGGGSSNQPDMLDETGAAKSVELAAPLLAALRAKAREYDSVEPSANGSRGAVASASRGQGGSSGAVGAAAGGASGGASGGAQQAYGMSQKDFEMVAGQLESVGKGVVVFASLPGGILTKPPTEKKQSSAESIAAGSGGVQKPSSTTSTFDKEVVVARAGDICPARPEAAINTDYAVPVFFEILECGELKGARVKGTIQKAPDDFVISFGSLTLPPQSKYKLLGAVEGVSASVSKEGSPGVADDVDRHWGSRLMSSGLLAMARTERSFIAARGSQTINTGTSSSISVDPLTAEEKRTARTAALMEGAMDVVSKDLSYGVNRAPTMTMKADTVIGIQFMSDVKVVPRGE